MRTPLGVIIFVSLIGLLDTYVFQAIRSISETATPRTKTILYTIYWGLTALTIISFLLFVYTPPDFLGKKTRTYLFAILIGLFFAKLVASVFFLIDDIRRGFQWAAGKLIYNNPELEQMSGDGISRSAFLSWLGLVAGGSLFTGLLYGFSNKYNQRTSHHPYQRYP
ncbi:MAG: hypothetical protein NTX08_06625 [Sphingobacteriales bacterium]|nr:hypothetical protein [Sphingobacteriales bacterium]